MLSAERRRNIDKPLHTVWTLLKKHDIWANSHKDVLIIRLNLPIESANKNTQNSEMDSACFCPRFSSLKNGRKNGIINSERIISTEDLPCHTTKRRGMRFRRTMKRMILPETSLPSMTKNIRPHNFRFMPKREKTILNAGRIKNNHSCTRPRITTHSCR